MPLRAGVTSGADLPRRMSRWGLVISGAVPRGWVRLPAAQGLCVRWHRDRAPGDSPARRSRSSLAAEGRYHSSMIPYLESFNRTKSITQIT